MESPSLFKKERSSDSLGRAGAVRRPQDSAFCIWSNPLQERSSLKVGTLRPWIQDGMKEVRRKLQVIFQDPYSSLNPKLKIKEIIGEPLVIYDVYKPKEREEYVNFLLEKVGLLPEYGNRYPHEFSGGQRQRVGIARALALRPKLIIADEPVSALDVSIQAQIINLLEDLQHEFSLAYILISHDLSVIEHVCDRIAVMYLGRIVEIAPYQTIFTAPLHPYTQALLTAIPIPDPHVRKEKMILKGEVPSPTNPPSGCRFHTRCDLRKGICTQEDPPLRAVGPDHFVACHLAGSPPGRPEADS